MSVKKKSKAKRPPHRPTDFKKSYVSKAYRLAQAGLTDAQMGAHFGVNEATINNWKRAHPDFLVSIKNGKEFADANVKSSLYHRAMGNGKPGQKNYVPASDTAIIFFLKNRCGDEYQDRKVLDHDGGVPVKPTEYDKEMSHDAIMRYAAKHQQSKEKPHDTGSKRT